MGTVAGGRGTVLRFSGFELDSERAELRRPDGGTIKLRPKTLEMLRLLAGNAGRVLSKQQLMEASGRTSMSARTACSSASAKSAPRRATTSARWSGWSLDAAICSRPK
jgi:DNA-binding response OmpR family regulator